MKLSISELEEKYLHDPYFHDMTLMLGSVLEAGHMEPDEIAGACVLAVKHYRENQGGDSALGRMMRENHQSTLGIGERIRGAALESLKGE